MNKGKILSDIRMHYSHHCEHLLERLNKQRQAGFLCDCTVVIGEFQFKAHRNVLASFSEYFGAIYRSTSENNVFLDQSQVKADGFQKLLEFIYTGTLNLDRCLRCGSAQWEKEETVDLIVLPFPTTKSSIQTPS